MVSGNRGWRFANDDRHPVGGEATSRSCRSGKATFAVHILLLGYLIWISNPLPRIVGFLLIAGYVANSLRVLLILDWPAPTRTIILLTAIIAELCSCYGCW